MMVNSFSETLLLRVTLLGQCRKRTFQLRTLDRFCLFCVRRVTLLYNTAYVRKITFCTKHSSRTVSEEFVVVPFWRHKHRKQGEQDFVVYGNENPTE